MGYYGVIRLQERENGRKIWYLNNRYVCDCVNTTFDSKEEVEEYKKTINLKKIFFSEIESFEIKKRNNYHYKKQS